MKRRKSGCAPASRRRDKLTLRAYHEGGQVNIEIADDGAGIDVARVKQKALEKGLLRPEQADKLSDREALNLIFHARLLDRARPSPTFPAAASAWTW